MSSESRNEKKETLLHIAVRQNSLDTVNLLLDKYKVSKIAEDEAHWTPFGLAVLRLNFEMMKILIDEKNVLERVGPKKELPLALVADAFSKPDLRHPFEAIEILISMGGVNGIGLNEPNSQGGLF